MQRVRGTNLPAAMPRFMTEQTLERSDWLVEKTKILILDLGGPFSDLLGAGDEFRTRDPQLGKLMLYQLSYSRAQKRVPVFRRALL